MRVFGYKPLESVLMADGWTQERKGLVEAEGIVNLVIYLRHSEPASGGRLSLLRTNIPTSMIHYEYYIKRISIKNRGEKRQKAEVLHRQD